MYALLHIVLLYTCQFVYMIDYISMLIFFKHKPFPSGRVLSVDSDGQVQWECQQSIEAVSSYQSKLYFKSQKIIGEEGMATEIFVKGNPSKFLQGHNIFGSSDLLSMIKSCFSRIPLIALLNISDHSIRNAIVSRIDFTKSIQFENLIQASTYISQVSLRACTRSGRPISKGHTLCFQPNSRRWTMVVYSKGHEISAHPLSELTPHKQYLFEIAQPLVRIELRLKTLELTDLNLRLLGSLTSNKLNELYAQYLERIEMNTIADLPTELITSLPRCYRDTYFMWHQGIDVQRIMKTPTFYRHRSELKNYGIDIAVPHDTESKAEIIPLTKAIKAVPFEIPQLAIDRGLCFGMGRSLAA